MWYGSMFQPCSDEEITSDILKELTKILASGMPPGSNGSATTTATAAIAVQNIQNAAPMLSLLRTGVAASQRESNLNRNVETSTSSASSRAASHVGTDRGGGAGSGSVSGGFDSLPVEFDFAW